MCVFACVLVGEVGEIEAGGQVSPIPRRLHPSFEARTGWKIDGGYAPMPADLRKHLAEFYAPFNKMLFEMVGETYNWQ